MGTFSLFVALDLRDDDFSTVIFRLDRLRLGSGSLRRRWSRESFFRFHDRPATGPRTECDKCLFRIPSESPILPVLHPIPSPEFTASPPALAFDSDSPTTA